MSFNNASDLVTYGGHCGFVDDACLKASQSPGAADVILCNIPLQQQEFLLY